ncbi:MAG: TolC family protein [Cellulophaga sp.]
MRIIFFSLFLISQTIMFGQSKKIKLTEAIELAKKKSPEYKAISNTTEASYWRYRNYKSDFLPQLSLKATLPEYSNATRRIINDEGQDIFVSQNQSIIDARLNIAQQVPFTGGSLSINTQLERIDRYGSQKSSNYSLIPFSINYFQRSIFYNPFKWDRKIEPLLFEESKRDFVEKMERISVSTCNHYFGLLKAQMKLEIAKQNLSNQDTLYQIAKGRFKIGKIAENELLQMELSHLNAKNNVTTNTILLKKTSQNLARFLGLETELIELEVPETISDFTVDVNKALEEAKNNRKAVIEFRRRRLEGEKRLAEVKGSNRLEIDVRANFGLNRRASEYDLLFQDYDKQQNISVTLGIPIFDWGVSKSKRKMAEADLSLINANIEQDQQEFEQEIYLHTLNWSNQRSFLATSKKAKEIGVKRYDITKKRYILGKITITDLNLAQQEQDKAIFAYLNSLEKFWRDYYTLRQLTLYDFIKNEKIKVKDLLFD